MLVQINSAAVLIGAFIFVLAQAINLNKIKINGFLYVIKVNRLPVIFLSGLLTVFTEAYFMYIFQRFFDVSWISAGLETALILWLGVSASSLFNLLAIEDKLQTKHKFRLLNNLISFIAVGAVLGWLHP